MAATLQTRVIYGLNTEIASNAHYITDAEILYPVGNVIAVHNIPQRRQKLIRLPDKYEINIICVTPNKRYVALCEIGEKPTVSIYDLQTLKRKKLLGIPYDAPDVTKFSCADFSFDNKYLVAITGEPDQNMLVYNWEKGKVESTFKVANPQYPSAIADILACNPSDVGVVALGGAHTFKFLTVSETVWRPYGFSKAENLFASSMAWLNPDRLLLGTKDARIFYLENGDLKNIYRMTDTISMNLKIREEYVIQSSGSATVLAEDESDWESNVRCLIAFPRGFAYALGAGKVILFEKNGPHKYVKRNIYVVPPQLAKDENQELYKTNFIDINLSYDRLLVTTGWSQLFYATLWGPDLTMDPEPQSLKIMGQSLHYGPINDLSMCVWKPVFMTSGEIDHSVRLWDFETENLIFFKQYTENVCSVALHPTGLFCLIGFSDKLRFMNILIDDLLLMGEFAIRCCRIVSFSHGGHLFAAVNGNIVQVYTTIGFYNRFILKGHTGKVKALVWSQTDMKLLTLGAEGSIYQWDMATGQRSGETILKGINLNDVVLASDESFAYCIASDNYIREIKENTVSREHSLGDVNIYCMVLSKDDLALFAASPGGVILSYKCPLQEPLEYVAFHVHSVNITKIQHSYNEQYLVSTAVDGSLCIWRIFYPDTKGKVSRDIAYTREVLISKGDLEEKIQTITDLASRINELETEHAYKMRQIEVQHNDKVRDIHQGYCEAIEELKNKIDKLHEDHKNELNTINVEIVKMKSAHEEKMKQMETNYDEKLIVEYDKYQALGERMNEMRQDYEKRLEELGKQAAEKLQGTITRYEALLHEVRVHLEEARDEIANQTRMHEQLVSQIEDDADQEIQEIRANYEMLLYEEKQTNLKLKGEAGVMRNRYMTSQKDIEDLKRQIQRMQGEYSYFQKTIQELERNIADLKKEVNERDSTIQNREQQIYELKRVNQELEKFKFVLNYKITELKSQIEPRDQEIKDLKEKIQDMETELVNLYKTNVSLELQLQELREKLRAARRELQSEIQHKKRCEQVMKRIRVDLLDASSMVQEPHALKTAVMNLYHKYSSDEEFLYSRKGDLDVQCEFTKQRDHLERTIASLRKQVYQDPSDEDKGTNKTTEENVTLIAELNALREELKEVRKHTLHLEGLLGMRSRNIKPSEARKKLEEACYGHEQLQNQYKVQMQECRNIILALKDDINRLLEELSHKQPQDTRASF